MFCLAHMVRNNVEIPLEPLISNSKVSSGITYMLLLFKVDFFYLCALRNIFILIVQLNVP
jgi:hypothetical protein